MRPIDHDHDRDMIFLNASNKFDYNKSSKYVQLKFSGNADEIGTGQGLIDKWVELPVGSVSR